MKSPLKAWLLAFSALACVSGCGTMHNVWSCFDERVPQKLIYGGVREDKQSIREAAHLTISSSKPREVTNGISHLVSRTVDLPLSAVGDTLTLPITIPEAIDRAVNTYYFPDKAKNQPVSLDEVPESVIGQEERSQLPAETRVLYCEGWEYWEFILPNGKRFQRDSLGRDWHSVHGGVV